MMPDDKKKMAMLIIGKKSEDKEESMEKDYQDEDMEKDALHYCMKGFMKAIQHEDTEKALKLFKKLNHLSDMYMKDEDKEEEKDEY